MSGRQEKKTKAVTPQRLQQEDFFDIEPYREVTEVYTYKDGTTKETVNLLQNDMPFIGDFAKNGDVNKDTLYEWAKKYPELNLF